MNLHASSWLVQWMNTYVNDSINKLWNSETLIHFVLSAIWREDLIELELAGSGWNIASRLHLSGISTLSFIARRINPVVTNTYELLVSQLKNVWLRLTYWTVWFYSATLTHVASWPWLVSLSSKGRILIATLMRAPPFPPILFPPNS